MAVGCGANFAKYVLFVFNVIFWLGGLALLVTGLVFLFNKNLGAFQEILTNDQSALKAAAWVLIVIGGLSFIIGFAGCCGAIKENQCLLIVYTGLLGALLITEVAIAIYVSTRVSVLEKVTANEFNRLINLYPTLGVNDTGRVNPIKELVDKVQFELFECCGVNGSADWLSTQFYTGQTNLIKMEVPPSCCKDIGQVTGYDQLKYYACGGSSLVGSALSLRFQDGCSTKINQWIRYNFPIVVAVVSCVAFIEAVGIFLATCLCCSIRRRDVTTRRGGV